MDPPQNRCLAEIRFCAEFRHAAHSEYMSMRFEGMPCLSLRRILSDQQCLAFQLISFTLAWQIEPPIGGHELLRLGINNQSSADGEVGDPCSTEASAS